MLWYRVTKFAKFSLVKGRTFAIPAAHPHPNYMGVPTRGVRNKVRAVKLLKPNRNTFSWLSTTDAKILDGAAVAQILQLCTAKTFQNYADLVFISYVKSHLETADREDIAWDVYIPDSLKTETRESIFLHPIGANHKPAHC